jgi:(R,R)-butanediol dehydrogenase/meso-butanediol dehydrogenase/diacetyl reductase
MIENGRLPVDQLVDAEIGLGGLVKDGFEPLLNPGGSMMKILVKLRS